MSRRTFWANVWANIVAGIITLAVALVVYRVWRGRLPHLEAILGR